MPGPNEESPLSYLEITNHLPETIELAFHGEPYVWAPGEKVLCTTEAAAHIFGFGLDIKGRTAAFHRLGWISTQPGANYKAGMEKLKHIAFKPVEQVFQMPNEEERSERRRRRRKVSLSDRPLAQDGEGSGGSEQSDVPATPAASGTDDEPLF